MFYTRIKISTTNMIIIPAIDLKNGKCVRLYQGDFQQQTIYNDNPLEQALQFKNAGFQHLHIVNLDGSLIDNNNDDIKKNNNNNIAIISEIAKNSDLTIQVGGGIRDLQDIENLLKIGVDRVIIGTMAVKNYPLAIEACKEFPNKIIIGIDSKDDFVATSGWLENNKLTTIELAMKFTDKFIDNNSLPLAIIYTDIAKDGTLSGFNITSTINLADAVNIPIIASGGLSHINDLITLKNLKHQNIAGAIIGKAWYDKKITITELKNYNFI